MHPTSPHAFDWSALVSVVVHPLKVTIVETMAWIDRPLSASDLTKLIGDEKFGLSHISYHLVSLAEVGVLEVVRKREVRGATEKFYFFP
jgi:DNA-binding transcriptional ArsR family regulator